MNPMRSSFVTWLTSVLLLSLAARGATVSFSSAATYSVGTHPIAVVSGDFNGDGKKDLAVLNFGNPATGDNGSVSILLGNGDGTFQAARNAAIGKNCTAAVAGDFDSDGRDDLALVRPGDATVNDNGDVSVFLSNSDGSFRPGQVLTPGKNPSSATTAIVVHDFNDDKRLDLVVANKGDSTVSVLLGNGNGSFQAPLAYAMANPPGAVRLADLAGNGEQDLAVGVSINFISAGTHFLLGNGDGTFRQGPTVSTGAGVSLAADFNGDKKTDLIVYAICILFCRGKILPSLWLGNGDGSFQPTTLQQNVSAAADFDGDGKLDVAGISSTPDGTQLQVSQGNGDGTFLAPLSFGDGVASNAAIALAADVTGDHAPDIMLLNFDPTGANNSITVLVNSGTDFSLAASPLSPGTISPGQSASSTINLQLLTAFDNPVSLACSVQGTTMAAAPVCSFSSKSVTFDGNGKATATLRLTAPSGTAYLLKPSSPPAWPASGSLWFPLVGLGFFVANRKSGLWKNRRLWLFTVGLLLSFVICSQLGCGGGGTSPPPATQYSIVVTATSGATEHSAALSLTVQ